MDSAALGGLIGQDKLASVRRGNLPLKRRLSSGYGGVDVIRFGEK